MPIFSVVFTYFQLRFWYVLKQRKPGILWVWCPFSHESGWVQLICHVLLTHYKTYIGGRSYSLTTEQTICWNSVGFLDLHKQTWVASTDMNLLSFFVPWWNIKRCLQFRRNSNLLLFFLFFGYDTIWRIPRKRVARGGKLWSPETLLYPNISNYSVFAVSGESCYSST